VKPWKLQKFAGDVVYDLRNRNLLLPVVALLVALVAVPVLIARGGSDGGAGPFGFGTTSAQNAPETENAVVAYHPGVRNYKSRLNDRAAKDPFIQQYVPTASSSTSSSSSDSLAEAVSGTSGSDGTGVGGGSTGGGGGSTGGGSTSPGKVTHHITYFWWQADVQVGEAGTQLATMNNVKPFQFLPSPDKPVLTYIGTVGAGSQAVFLVSKDVTSIGGEGTCFPSVDACQLLGLNVGKGADLIYGPDQKTYHVQVLRLRRVSSDKPPSY
jgi:hypothetical protein